MKKKLLTFFLLFFLIGCSFNGNTNNNNSNNNSNNNNNNNNNNIDIINNSNKIYGFDDLYSAIVVKNNLETKWDKKLFSEFVLFFNNSFNKKDYLFLNGNYTIYYIGKVDKIVGISFLKNKKDVIYLFKNFEKDDLKYFSLNNFDILFKKFGLMSKEDYKNNFLFYNKNKNYFFFKKDFYEINGICRLFSGEIKSFNELSSGENITYDGTNLNSYKNISKELTLNNIEYKSFLSNNKKINDRLFVYKGLLKIVNEYINSGYDKKYKNLFYKKFDEQLSPYYSYSEYSLYFSMKKYDLLMKEGFCDKFNKEYFLAK